MSANSVVAAKVWFNIIFHSCGLVDHVSKICVLLRVSVCGLVDLFSNVSVLLRVSVCWLIDHVSDICVILGVSGIQNHMFTQKIRMRMLGWIMFVMFC